MTTPAAGWYPDPSGTPQLRYFDGNNWTDKFAPLAITPPVAPKKNRKALLSVVGAFAVLILLGKACSSDTPDGAKESTPALSPTATSAVKSPATVTKKTAAPAGSTVRDGKFEFQVLGVDRAATKEGIFKPEQAKGEFFIVHLRVTNIGDDARSFSASSQHLIVNGNKYDASSSISDENWMEDINPGLGIEASVTFDIPPGAVPEAIECHDSAFSGGALLAL